MIDNKARLQRKWDSRLIICFFEKPSYKIGWLVDNFCKDNGINQSELFELLRTPKDIIQFMYFSDVYLFVARHLAPLYKRLDASTIDDALSIAIELSKSNMTASKYKVSDYKKEAINKENDLKFTAQRMESQAHRDHLEKCSARNWMACK